MGQHKTNQNVAAVKRGELKPKAKAVKPMTKREESCLSQWEKVIARRPGVASESLKQQRVRRRKESRALAAQIREMNRLAMAAIRERKKAARRAA